MAVEFLDPQEKALRETYFLDCKVLVKEISYLDEQSKENVQRTEEMVFLVPKHSTQMELFFHAWLPEDVGGTLEIAMKAGHPIYGYFKGAVQRRNSNCKEHHIFVMSRGAEEDLKMLRGKTVKIEVLPVNQEYQADYMKNFSVVDNKADKIMSVDSRPPTIEDMNENT
jgi:hypothetical protein